jgi:uncharacterized protein (TIRG00374 family)
VALLNAIKFRYISKVFKLDLTSLEWNGLPFITTFHSYVMPIRTGNLFRATYLKTNYNLEYSKFIALLLGASYIDVLITSFLGIVATVFLKTITVQVKISIICIFFFALSSMIILAPAYKFITARAIKLKNEKVNRMLIRIQESVSYFKDARLELLRFSIVAVLSLLIRSITLQFCFFVLGSSASIMLVIVSICLTNFTILLSLTPGNLGVTEGALAATFFAVGVPMGTGLQVIALSRLTSIIIQLILGLPSSYILSGKLKFSRD